MYRLQRKTMFWGSIAFSTLLLGSGLYQCAKADVKSACASDYIAHCVHTVPFSASCRACMRSVGIQGGLSETCLAALKASGQITKTDVSNYRKLHDVSQN
jgi:hypothetical protein